MGSKVRVRSRSCVRVNVKGVKAFYKIESFAIRLWVFVRAILESLIYMLALVMKTGNLIEKTVRDYRFL